MAALALVLSSCSRAPAPVLNPADWSAFKARFIRADGRVVDDAKGGRTHSEGQGYGMLFAVAFDDRATFERIWRWTQKHLQVRDDYLFAWLWDDQEGRVIDTNNATDADLIIGWALMRAARHWSAQEYRLAASRIFDSLASLRIRVNGRLFLLPAAKGFYDADKLVLNPSHFVLPAYRELAEVDTHLDWHALYVDALALLKASRWGEWQLPPDWLDLRQGGRPWKKRPPYFSYDAIRIPLFAAWAGETELLQPYLELWAPFSMRVRQPDIVDLETGFVHLRQGFHAVDAIRRLCQHAAKGDAEPGGFRWDKHASYYSASLYLLSQMAWNELDLNRGSEGR